MKKFIWFALMHFLSFGIHHAGVKARVTKNLKIKNYDKIDLSGEWRFEIDSLDQGIRQQWFNRDLRDRIQLPGSMTTNGKGNDVDVNTPWTGGIVDSTWFFKPEYAQYREKGNI